LFVYKVRQANSQNNRVSNRLLESLLQIRGSVIQSLLEGCFGKYDQSLVAPTAVLLEELLVLGNEDDTTGHIDAAMVQFALGEDCKAVIRDLLVRSARHTVSSSDLVLGMEGVWTLYQSDDMEAIPTSDALAFFIKRVIFA
jgi:hypothetical protein